MHKKHKNVKQATFAQMFFIRAKSKKKHKKNKTHKILNIKQASKNNNYAHKNI